jgi:hypothetical protein
MMVCTNGCGDLQFVDAPFAPREITVTYSLQEDVTIIRWRLGAEKPPADARFEMLDPSGTWGDVDFSASLFPGGLTPCGDRRGVCAQLVLPGRYRPPDQPTVLRAVHPGYGLSPGNAIKANRTEDKTLTLKSYFERGNRRVVAKVTDWVGGDAIHSFPRSLERAMWERLAVCVPGFHPAEATFVPFQQAEQGWVGPPSLPDSGRLCAAVRPVTTMGRPGIDEPVAVDTLPEVEVGNHLYTAPTETTPFSYQIVLDLSIPVADRCTDAKREVDRKVAAVLGAASPLRAMPLIDLGQQQQQQQQQQDPSPAAASDCQQSPWRTLDAVATAQDVKREAATWPEQHQRFFLLYFNNLRAPLPAGLMSSLADFETVIATSPPASEFSAGIWAFGPEEMTGSFGGWSATTPWLSSSDPSFEMQLQDFALQGLPLLSEIHDPLRPVPILDPDEAQRLAGGLIRLCQVSVAPLPGTALRPIRQNAQGEVTVLPPTVREWPVEAPHPPAYLLDLPPVWAVPKSSFTPHQAQIRYEVCTRFCDHGFTAESGVEVADGWLGSPLCMGPPPESRS